MPSVKANGKTFEFPKGTSNADIGLAIDEYFASNNSAPDANDLGDAPDVFNQFPEPEQAPAPESSFADNAIGAGEAALTMATGATGGLVGTVGGVAEGVFDEVRSGEFGTPEAANRIADSASQGAANLTYAPRTEKGQEIVQSIGELAEPLAPLAGLSAPLGQIGRSAKAAAPGIRTQAAKAGQDLAPVVQPVKDVALGVFNYQSPTKQKIAQLLFSGSTDRDVSGYKLSSSGASEAPQGRLAKALNIGGPRVVNDKLSLEAEKQGFDSGVLAPTKAASAIDKRKFLEMVEIMETGKRNSRYAVDNRPSDVAGDTLLEQFKTIRTANSKSGKEIGNIADGLEGKSVDLNAAVLGFDDALKNVGISLVDDDKGGFKPNFELSELPPGDRAPIKEVIRQMSLKGRGEVDGLIAHKMKKIIDRNVTFGKVKTAMSNDAETILKDFRRGIDDSLDKTFPKYDKANKTYAETIEILNKFQQIMGKTMDLTGPNADKAIGTALRSLMSKSQRRIPQMDIVFDIDNLSKKYGVGDKRLIGKDGGEQDLKMQILFADELDSMFGTAARTSFSGQIGQEIKRGGQAAKGGVRGGVIDLGIDLAAAVGEKARNINQQAAFDSIKKLLREGK
jgi:hypothetical protein